ncbi:hypothetical protein [Litoribrevibacter albus]|uniref:Uncharacterized protein n=1 Tax=Litoribrevibacter albus TaxID=1473156 RepID=A0AA37S7Q5_9GAMM|nr:hypothetical protein [Litoribrevibacter albus]GLQ29629.1 hypothetical protein GCM10007876_01070 [Litoribrevibacter albus]
MRFNWAKKLIQGIRYLFLIVATLAGVLGGTLSCANPAFSNDWVYSVTMDGEDIGQMKTVINALPAGQQITETSELLIPSIWGDTEIHSYKHESYGQNDNRDVSALIKASYLTLYNDYLMLVDITPAHRGLLKYHMQWFELNQDQSEQVKASWKQLSISDTISTAVDGLISERMQAQVTTLKTTETYSTFLDPNDFDMTLTAFNLRLPKLLPDDQKRSFRLFDPESDHEVPFYQVTAQLASAKPLQQINVDYDGGGRSVYQYDVSEESSRLVTLHDESGEESIVLKLRHF